MSLFSDLSCRPLLSVCFQLKHLLLNTIFITSPLPPDVAQLVLHFNKWQTWYRTVDCVWWCACFSRAPGEKGKQAVGISILIIRPKHLLKKLLPAAVEEHQISLRSSASIGQLWPSRERAHTHCSFALCLHPTTLPRNNWDCCVASTPLQHLRPITNGPLCGLGCFALLLYLPRIVSPPPSPSVSLCLSSSADPLFTEQAVWAESFEHHTTTLFENMPSLFM